MALSPSAFSPWDPELGAAAGRIDAAWTNGGPKAVKRLNAHRYAVTGRFDGRHTVYAHSAADLECDCTLGRVGRPCWHAAAVHLRLIGDGER